jgi:hypothetical protein
MTSYGRTIRHGGRQIGRPRQACPAACASVAGRRGLRALRRRRLGSLTPLRQGRRPDAGFEVAAGAEGKLSDQQRNGESDAAQRRRVEEPSARRDGALLVRFGGEDLGLASSLRGDASGARAKSLGAPPAAGVASRLGAPGSLVGIAIDFWWRGCRLWDARRP